MSAPEQTNVVPFPRVPRRLCEAYLDRTHNAVVIILPVEVRYHAEVWNGWSKYRYDFHTWQRVPRDRGVT